MIDICNNNLVIFVNSTLPTRTYESVYNTLLTSRHIKSYKIRIINVHLSSQRYRKKWKSLFSHRKMFKVFLAQEKPNNKSFSCVHKPHNIVLHFMETLSKGSLFAKHML